MKVLVITHPNFLNSQSMPRFANMLEEGLKAKGCKVDVVTAKSFLYQVVTKASIRKWLGYIDQYVIFPFHLKQYIKKADKDTLFVLVDNALGPWAPYVAHLPHVIHCHDFMAQQSAIGEIAENPTGFTGRLYQTYIRRGYRKAKYFISVSKKTQADLHRFLNVVPNLSTVIYNGLNRHIALYNKPTAMEIVSVKVGRDLSNGFILHVGGNQWYKNRVGLVEAYIWCRQQALINLPLLLVGTTPNQALATVIANSNYQQDIVIVADGDDTFLDAAYCAASLLFFPSLNEGFGWPIAEAMYCGCPVVTTNVEPMTEVGGDIAFYVERMPLNDTEKLGWYQAVGAIFTRVLQMEEAEILALREKGQKQAAQFDTDRTISNIIACYETIINDF